MTVDLSGLNYLLPLFGFFLVFIVTYSALTASKVLEDKWVKIFLSFLISSIFVTAIGARAYILNISVWFAVLIVSLFFILVLVGFTGNTKEMGKGIGIAFFVLMMLAFLVSFIFVFSDYFAPYLPGLSYGDGANPSVLGFTDWLYSSRVMGAVLLIAIGALVSWILVRK